MDIRKVSDSIHIYSDGKRLQVIHNLGDEFILDLNLEEEKAYNVESLYQFMLLKIEPIFKVCGFCSKAGEGMQRLKHAINHFEIFEQYVKKNQEDLMVWWHNPGREVND